MAREGSNIFRTTFMRAGQAIAVSTRTGTTRLITYYYLFNDHLGSASTMTTTGGSVVHQARFLPFGGTRGWGSAPTTAWLDRGYTGHLHNDGVGLIYTPEWRVHGFVCLASAAFPAHHTLPLPHSSHGRTSPCGRLQLPLGHAALNLVDGRDVASAVRLP